MKHIIFFIVIVLSFEAQAQTDTLVDVKSVFPNLHIALLYATHDNFLNDVLYSQNICYLRKEAVEKLKKADGYQKKYYPLYHLKITDCHRPLAAQKKMWDKVKNTAQKKYVANPYTQFGSLHNYGLAIDITLEDDNKNEQDMGTQVDFLGSLSERKLEKFHIEKKKLTLEHVKNRNILREIMIKGGGFRSIDREWWHFEVFSPKEVYENYTKIEKWPEATK